MLSFSELARAHRVIVSCTKKLSKLLLVEKRCSLHVFEQENKMVDIFLICKNKIKFGPDQEVDWIRKKKIIRCGFKERQVDKCWNIHFCLYSEKLAKIEEY